MKLFIVLLAIFSSALVLGKGKTNEVLPKLGKMVGYERYTIIYPKVWYYELLATGECRHFPSGKIYDASFCLGKKVAKKIKEKLGKCSKARVSKGVTSDVLETYSLNDNCYCQKNLEKEGFTGWSKSYDGYSEKCLLLFPKEQRKIVENIYAEYMTK